MVMLFATLINFGIDAFYFLWVMVLRGRLPPSLGGVVSDAVFGFTKKLTRELYSNLDPSQRGLVEETKHVIAMEKQAAQKKAVEEAEAAKLKQEKEKDAAKLR